MKKILAQGAEATISLLDNKIIKNRLKKSYRLPAIDEKLRKQRTKAEAKILKKLYIHLPVPKLISTDDKSQLTLEYLDGGKIADILSKKNCLAIAKQIAQNITKMHDLDIIHADLTTSNMIYKNKQVFFIDFGLSYHSKKIEDKAVDLHVLGQALQAKHPTIYKKVIALILKHYIPLKHKEILQQLKKVESRGRYKEKY